MTSPPDQVRAPLSPAAAQLSAALQARAERVTVDRATLVEAFGEALPGAASGEHARSTLATLLYEIAEHGIIGLPTARTKWDAGRPALPEQVRIPTAAPVKSSAPRRHVSWRPELDWAYRARLTASQTEDLLACNRWFRDTHNRPDRRAPLSLRERSYEIFRHEKRLDSLITGALFAPGRLTLEQLATYREPPPLAHRRLGDGDTVLVVENSDTYATLYDLLKNDPGRIGHIAFGSGRAFEASVENIAELSDIHRIVYYGDLDAEGIAIPARASINGVQHGLPPIEPATGLYRLLLAHEPTASDIIASDRAHSLTAWLPGELRQAAHDLLTKGQRLAQEATNRNELGPEPSWRWRTSAAPQPETPAPDRRVGSPLGRNQAG
ncbi:Wadjet anti-phage system protein JetD domain-containing protein [Streptomyces sp. NPDC006475]|uniref:Wadjet anti-phage system protein JetD domain-containing protein n=1 Tax=Streptomyces sp. NPDC006475 TaxID=3155719 RepID=UPI0033AA52C4